MSDNLCPYGSSCPQVIATEGEIKSISDRIEVQNKFMVEKMNDISSDVKEVKNFLNEKLDDKIDSRVNIAMDKMQAKMFRWCLGALLGSGGLSAVLTLLLH